MSRRRLAIALALSLLGHALLLLVARGFPGRQPGVKQLQPATASTLTMSLSGPHRQGYVAAPGEWMDMELGTPTLVFPPVPASATSNDHGPFLSGFPQVAATGSDKSAASTSGNSGGSGKAVGPSLLAVAGTARRVVYLLDRSVSMGLSDAFDRARQELAASLQSLAPEVHFAVYTYNRAATAVLPTTALLPAKAQNISQVISQLSTLSPGGDTNHLNAIRGVLLLRPDLLIVLTDADDLTRSDVQAITKANQGRTTIDAVELTRNRMTSIDSGLSLLASQNQGKHRRILLNQDGR